MTAGPPTRGRCALGCSRLVKARDGPGADKGWKQQVNTMAESAANLRQKKLFKTVGRKMTPHLWTGIIEGAPARRGRRRR